MAVSKSLRFQVLRRDNHTCRYCGRSAPEVRITVDHVVPSALGGTDAADNLVAACSDCNSGKSATPPDAAQVEQVRDDALRWAAAVRSVAEEMVADSQHRDALCRRFFEAWQRWKVNDRPLELPPAWRESVDNFLAAGLPMPVLIDCIELAMGRTKVANDDKFRYMCGIAWARVAELQQAALQRVARPTPRDAVRQGNGDEVISYLFGALPWCDGPETWGPFIAEFEQRHRDDEEDAANTFDHWSDFEKMFAESVARVADSHDAFAGFSRACLAKLAPESAQRYRDEARRQHEAAGEPNATQEWINNLAVLLAISDHPDAAGA